MENSLVLKFVRALVVIMSVATMGILILGAISRKKKQISKEME